VANATLDCITCRPSRTVSQSDAIAVRWWRQTPNAIEGCVMFVTTKLKSIPPQWSAVQLCTALKLEYSCL